MDEEMEVIAQPETSRDAPSADDLERAKAVSADVVVLPLGRTTEGLGQYDEHVIGLVKALREAGLHVEFLDPVETRAFTVRKSAEADILVSLLTNLAAAGIWTAGAGAIRRFRRAHPNARLDVHEGEAAKRVAPKDSGPRALPAVAPIAPTDADQDSASASPHLARTIARLTLEGKALLGEAALTLDVDEEEAEAVARGALRRLRSALDWAEDGPSEATAHDVLDAAGRWVRTRFTCKIGRDGEIYSITCPVRLAHDRVGLSIGGRSHKTCSLCGDDLSECEHLPGRQYLVAGGRADLGWCRVCLSKDGCEHEADESYRAPVVSIVDRIDLEEVSLVGKPALPDARIERVTVSVSELAAMLGPDFKAGMDVSCDFCLIPCSGLRRPFGNGAVPPHR